MPWISLESADQLADLVVLSHQQPILFFKHSTRCSISTAAWGRMERGEAKLPPNVKCVYLDLIRFRALSNQIAELFNVAHESPQVLLVHQGQCVYHASHFDIRPEYVPIISKTTNPL